MIIDFHTHTFPERIASRALDQLSERSNIIFYRDGMLDSLKTSMKAGNIDYSVVLPVATSPSQHDTINRVAAEINEHSEETGIISFAGIHPDNDNYKDILKSIKNNGFKGIKLHPVYQGTAFDDIRYMRIVYEASSLGLINVVHAGYDIGFIGNDNVVPERIVRVLDEVKPEKLVLAHMGGWYCYNDVMSMLAGRNVYFDTAFSINPIEPRYATVAPNFPDSQLTDEHFVNIVRAHGADKVLFGTDTPWADQGKYVERVKETGLTEAECELILSENARKLLF